MLDAHMTADAPRAQLIHIDRKSTRLNSSHTVISYAVFCLKKKKTRFPAAVVSADSMQVYRGLPILTNQPSTPARLVGVWGIDHDSSVAENQHLAHAAIHEVRLGFETGSDATLAACLDNDVAHALAWPSSTTVRKAMGLEEMANLVREYAIQELNLLLFFFFK